MGGGQAIMINLVNGTLMGASDPRKDGVALGYCMTRPALFWPIVRVFVCRLVFRHAGDFHTNTAGFQRAT